MQAFKDHKLSMYPFWALYMQCWNWIFNSDSFFNPQRFKCDRRTSRYYKTYRHIFVLTNKNKFCLCNFFRANYLWLKSSIFLPRRLGLKLFFRETHHKTHSNIEYKTIHLYWGWVDEYFFCNSSLLTSREITVWIISTLIM